MTTSESKRAKKQSLAVWDVTARSNGNHEEIMSLLKALGKKWVFQEEKPPLTLEEAIKPTVSSSESKDEVKDTFKHWQIRISLVKKSTLNGILKAIKDTALEGSHWSPTTRGQRDGFDYVLKSATRIAGPWRDGEEDEKREEPDQIKGKSPRKWQVEVIEDLKRPITEDDRRKVNVLYDPCGGIGKSILRTMCQYHKWAAVPPYFTEMKDMMAYALRNRNKAYVIDVPRDSLMKKIKEFWVGIESLKDGRVYDTRYKYEEAIMDNPKIWILTNTMPDLNWMSRDRWVIWMVDTKDELLDVTDAPEKIIEKITSYWQAKKESDKVNNKKRKRTDAEWSELEKEIDTANESVKKQHTAPPTPATPPQSSPA